MIRVTGVLAVVASVALVILLIGRTSTAEFRGPISGPPLGVKPGQPAYTPAPPGTRPVYIVKQGEPTPQEMERLVMAGITMTGMGESDATSPMTMYWGFQVPDAVAREAQVGGELVIRARNLSLPSMNALAMTHVRYELRGGLETHTFGEPANGKFMLVCGLIVGAPLVLWGVAAGVLTLCDVIKKGQPPE